MGAYYLIGGDSPGAPATAICFRAQRLVRDRERQDLHGGRQQKLFTDTCKALGHPEWATDPRFATIADSVANKPMLMKMMEDVLKTDTKENWAQKLRHLPAGPIRTMKEALDEPEVKRRGMLKTYKHSQGRRRADDRIELPLLRHAGRRHPPAASLGEHTERCWPTSPASASRSEAAAREEDHRLAREEGIPLCRPERSEGPHCASTRRKAISSIRTAQVGSLRGASSILADPLPAFELFLPRDRLLDLLEFFRVDQTRCLVLLHGELAADTRPMFSHPTAKVIRYADVHRTQ